MTDRLVHETLELFRAAVGASGAMFYWIAPSLETENDLLLDLPAGLTERYRAEMSACDPLLAARLARAGKSVAELQREAPVVPRADWLRYRAYLDDYAVAGNIDLLFWSEERAFAGVSLLWFAGDPLPQSTDLCETLHRYVTLTLAGHERVAAERQRELLSGIGLTRREREVCKLITRGAANQDIADLLGVSLATVKGFVKQVFDKTGVGSRTALMARLEDLARH